MLVAAGQFAVTSVWEKNAEICASLMAQAAEKAIWVAWEHSVMATAVFIAPSRSPGLQSPAPAMRRRRSASIRAC